MNIQDLDRQYVARLGVRHRDGPGERVEAVPVETLQGAGVGVRSYLAV